MYSSSVVGPPAIRKENLHDRFHSRRTERGSGGFLGLVYDLFLGAWLDIWDRSPVRHGIVWPAGRQDGRIPKTNGIAIVDTLLKSRISDRFRSCWWGGVGVSPLKGNIIWSQVGIDGI